MTEDEMHHFSKVLIAIGNQRQRRGYGGANALNYLEREGLIMIDPEWSGCLALTDKGWDRYEFLTGQGGDADA